MSIPLDSTLSTRKDSSTVSFCDLYVIHLKTGEIYYTNNDVDISWYIPGTTTEQIYQAQPIQRGKLTQTSDDKVDSVDLQISDITQDFSSALLSSFDFRGVYVSIYQIDRVESIGKPTAYKYVFYGFMDTPGLDESTGTFTCSLLQDIPNQTHCRTMMLTCNAWFGDADECGAAVDTRTSTLLAGSTSKTIVHAADSTGENYWINGTITIGYESRQIKSSNATSITVDIPFFSTPITGSTISYTNGCNKSYSDCKRLNNTKNYSGFLAIPLTEYVVTT